MKLKNSKGFTLVEILVAVAVVVLICAGLAAGLPAALRVYNDVTLQAESESLFATLSTAVNTELAKAEQVTVTDGVVSWNSSSFGDGVSLVSGEFTVQGRTQPVKMLQISLASEGRTCDLVAKHTYTNGLGADATVQWSGEYFTVSMEIIDSDGKVRQTGDVVVRPMSPQ